MQLQINATRMSLLSYKKKLKLAKKGHKLLKDKLEELVRRFIKLVREYQKKRGDIESSLRIAYKKMFHAQINMSRLDFNEFIYSSPVEAELKVGSRKIMNIDVPELEVEIKGNIFSYSLSQTNVHLDDAIADYINIVKKMLELSSIEKAIYLLAAEIEKTRRRVNSLEYILIPNFEDAIKFINMKLDERSRSELTQLMKVKEMIVKKREENEYS
ncbi:V-type ATP synthase subunit D [bacterium]|nr:V-type ATP synthase subunit D [bacterium]MCK5598736.1 V-type ATP synthase subunit D [bacterium]